MPFRLLTKNQDRGYFNCCGYEKKGTESSECGDVLFSGYGYPLEAFRQRLRDVCADDVCHTGGDRASIEKNEAKQAVFVARELGLLKQEAESWEGFAVANADLHFGTEHAVEASPAEGLMVKITIPPDFGLVPQLARYPVVDLSDEANASKTREALEFGPASLLEYLDRWIAANDVFGDNVRLASVVEWPDDRVSIVILQPQYHGRRAEFSEIELFVRGGWTRILDPSGQHALFFNYAFEILAIDAVPRNCHMNENGLQPFDVILCRPDEEMERYLRLYPDC